MTRQLLEISMSCEHCVLLLPQVEPSTEVKFISFQSGVHIHYSSSSKSTGRKAGKIHHCDLADREVPEFLCAADPSVLHP